jgi:hypothetical protein
MGAVSQPPIFAVTLVSAKQTHTTVLGNGIATEFDVTNTGTRDVVLMNAQIVAKDKDGKGKPGKRLAPVKPSNSRAGTHPSHQT